MCTSRNVGIANARVAGTCGTKARGNMVFNARDKEEIEQGNVVKCRKSRAGGARRLAGRGSEGQRGNERVVAFNDAPECVASAARFADTVHPPRVLHSRRVSSRRLTLSLIQELCGEVYHGR